MMTASVAVALAKLVHLAVVVLRPFLPALEALAAAELRALADRLGK